MAQMLLHGVHTSGPVLIGQKDFNLGDSAGKFDNHFQIELESAMPMLKQATLFLKATILTEEEILQKGLSMEQGAPRKVDLTGELLSVTQENDALAAKLAEMQAQH